jgi:2'-5' RNA ligase
VPDDRIRCFIAAELPHDLLQEIGQYIRSIAAYSSGVRWVKPTGIHITLKFLGEITPSAAEQVRDVLEGINQVAGPFDMTIRGSGFFPNRRQPRVIWLGLEHDPEHSLFKLHEWLDQHLAALGFEREKRRFSPHLTLGRIKGPEKLEPVFNFLDEHPFPDKTFRIDRIFFIRSSLQPGGAVYSTIADYPLEG